MDLVDLGFVDFDWILGILDFGLWIWGVLDFDFGFGGFGFWILGILDFDFGDFGFWILLILFFWRRSRGCTTRQFGDGAWRSEARIPLVRLSGTVQNQLYLI